MIKPQRELGIISLVVNNVASPADVFRGDRISSLPTREEIRSPLKTSAGEAITAAKAKGEALFKKFIIYLKK